MNETCLELLSALDEVDKPYFEPIVQQAADKIKAEEARIFYLMLQHGDPPMCSNVYLF